MGLWGLILGFVSIVSQSVSAVNTNIIREVAATDESQFKEKTNILLVNGMVIYGFFFIVLSIITLTTFSLIFYKEIKAYQGLISLVLVGMFINLLATIFSSVLDGKKLNYIKNSLQIFSNLFYLIACYFFVEPFNLFGIAMAQIVQALIMLIGISYFVFYKLHISLKISNISKSEIVLFFRESWKLQAISFFVLCYEPITKYFLSRFGLSFVAKYEIANRIISQIRNFFVASNQTLLSVFVNKLVEGKRNFIEYYEITFSRNLRWVVLFFGISILSTPIISYFFLKNLDLNFFIIYILLVIGNIINIVSIPAYFNFFAKKNYSTPLYSHLIIAIFNITLTSLLSKYFEGYGVVLGWSISLIIGSIIILNTFHKEESINNILKIIFSNKYTLTLLFTTFIVAGFSFFNLYNLWVIIPLSTLLACLYVIRFYKQFLKNE